MLVSLEDWHIVYDGETKNSKSVHYESETLLWDATTDTMERNYMLVSLCWPLRTWLRCLFFWNGLKNRQFYEFMKALKHVSYNFTFYQLLHSLSHFYNINFSKSVLDVTSCNLIADVKKVTIHILKILT